MGRTSKPKAGSKGVYPRVRAKTIIPKFNTFKEENGIKVQNFFGYKVGMHQVFGVNKHKGSAYNGMKVKIPITIIEVPKLNVAGIRFYKGTIRKKPIKEFLFKKFLSKNIDKTNSTLRKGKDKDIKEMDDFYNLNKEAISNAVILAETNPAEAGLPKKKSEMVELYLSGKVDEQMAFIKERLGKPITVDDFSKESAPLDVTAVSIGKGFQGVIKRYGVKRRHHKSQKGVRKVGSIGAWHPPLVMRTAPMPGQMGFHNRTIINCKYVGKCDFLKMPKSFGRYGTVKSEAIMVAGSIPGPKKRMVALRHGIRKFVDTKFDISEVLYN